MVSAKSLCCGEAVRPYSTSAGEWSTSRAANMASMRALISSVLIALALRPAANRVGAEYDEAVGMIMASCPVVCIVLILERIGG